MDMKSKKEIDTPAAEDAPAEMPDIIITKIDENGKQVFVEMKRIAVNGKTIIRRRRSYYRPEETE